MEKKQKKTLFALNALKNNPKTLSSLAVVLCLVIVLPAFIVFSMPVSAAVTSTLGQTAKGGSVAWQPSNEMIGSRFTSQSAGVANSISVYLTNPSSTSVNVKCSIYRESDQTLVATTEQKGIASGSDGWQTFNFASAPSLSAGASYSIVVWFSSSNLRVYYSSSSSTQSWYASQAFGNFPTGPYASLSGFGQENLVYSIYATVSLPTDSPTTSPNPTQAVVNIGQTTTSTTASTQPSGIMVASRFTSSVSGLATSVTAYLTNVGSSAGTAKCAIYRESDKTLLASTQEKSIGIGSQGWQTFNFATAPSLTAGTSYSIVIWFANSNLQISYASGTTCQSWYAGQTYGNFPTGPYTGFASYNQENVVYSLYTSVGSSAASTNPTSSPTPPTPTATPIRTVSPTATPRPSATPTRTVSPTATPQPSSTTAKNLAIIPDAWGPGYYPTVSQYAFTDTSVTHNGNPSMRLQKGGNTDPFGVIDRSIWTNLFSCKPGDHIVASIWIRTDSSSTGDTSMGARLGIDLYGSGHIVDGYPGTHIDTTSNYVHWGTSTWTQRTYDFIVPNTVYTHDQTGASISGTQINGVLLWIQARPGTDNANAWFSDATLYINP